MAPNHYTTSKYIRRFVDSGHIIVGTVVQVAPLKYGAVVAWRAGMVVSINSGQLMIKVPNEPKERMYILRNFIPPNVPVIRLEKGFWRILPREIDISTDIYIGSCLSLLNLVDNDDSVDVVIVNVFFSQKNSPIAPVKPPYDETDFHSVDDSGSSPNQDDSMEDSFYDKTCSCDGFTLRIFEGKLVGIPERVLVHSLHDKKEHMLKVSELKGFKLNYDLQAHFDGPTINGQFPNGVWVVPRNISFLGDSLVTKESTKPGYSWLFKPQYCLVIFPFNRNMDVLQDLCRLIPFLHPELNYLALCAGLWSLRNKPDLKERESVSYTRSQKAAIRDLTSNDVVSEVCADLSRSPLSLVRRLYCCYPVISLWIALDSCELDHENDPTIPKNIRVPSPTRCTKCNGTVISKSGMVKVICNKYTQILSKKLNKKSKEPTNNPSLETLPQLDVINKSRGSEGREMPKNDAETSDDGLPNRDSGSETAEKLKAGDVMGKSSEKDGSVSDDLKPQKQSSSGGDDKHGLSEKGSDEKLSRGLSDCSTTDTEGTNKDHKSKYQNSAILNALFPQGSEYESTPVLCDLEKTEELVKRMEAIANSRWRLTKEFSASCSVDDEFSILTTSPTTSAKTNSDFIIQLAGAMNNVKKGKDVQIDPSLVYKLYQLAEECNSTTEGALLAGWSSYLMNEHKSVQSDESHYNSHYHMQRLSFSMRSDKDSPVPKFCPVNLNLKSPPCPCVNNPSFSCPLRATHLRGSCTPQITRLGSQSRRCPVDLSSTYSQLLANNPFFTEMSKVYKRKRDDDPSRLTMAKLQRYNLQSSPKTRHSAHSESKASKNTAKNDEDENQYIDDPDDFCKFNDNPQRKKYIAYINWDEDLEF